MSEGVPAEVLVIDDFSRDGSQTLLRQLEALYYKDGFRCLAFGANAGPGLEPEPGDGPRPVSLYCLPRRRQRADPRESPPVHEDAGADSGGGGLWQLAGPHPHRGLRPLRAAATRAFRSKLFQGNYVDAFSVWDRVQFLDVGGYDASYFLWEDYEMWLHLATNGRRIVFVPAMLGYYYLLPVSMSIDLHETRHRQGAHPAHLQPGQSP